METWFRDMTLQQLIDNITSLSCSATSIPVFHSGDIQQVALTTTMTICTLPCTHAMFLVICRLTQKRGAYNY